MTKLRQIIPIATILGLLSLTFARSQFFNENVIQSQEIISNNSPESEIDCNRKDPFIQGIQKATEANSLAQSARTGEDWNLVVLRWLQAIEKMQSLPTSSPKYFFAQKKVKEYGNNLQVAQQKLTNFPIDLPFSSFNTQFLDEQILLYLSYIAAVGTPDILIVGSSRAVQGIHPRYLQHGLVSQNNEDLKVFNFGVNGATAEVVSFMLVQLLSQEQLPKLIIWGDGVRAFNSGRQDRTYQAIVSSTGYQELSKGYLPKLIMEEEPPFSESCEAELLEAVNNIFDLQFKQSNSFLDWLLPPALALDIKDIDAQGFLPVFRKFEPNTYYKSYPRVIGLYDGDYVNFSLQGSQSQALNQVVNFTKEKEIPLIFVNLPLTQDYLDTVRNRAEDQFRNFMNNQDQAGNLIFIDLSKQWLNQNHYFADPSHLNVYGATAIANQLVNNPQITQLLR
jgi:hypothetical protein